ncbi:MAG: hypothetical protein MZW92_07150 [Comamonadaceae bacterium]|nr:hypothetical protein [Comamonadaceae bacterium]
MLFSISYTGGTGNDVVLTRVNDAPSGSVTIAGTATQGQTLTASHTLADTDGLGTVRYQWMVNGIMVAVGSSYVLSQSDVGRAITVVADYTDSEGTVESRASAPTAPVANINDAPTGQVLVAGSTVLGQTLVASNTLADIDGMGTVAYQWQADGVDIAGATGASHLLSRAEIGHVITAKASYTDAYGAVETVVSSATSRVVDGNGVAPSIEQEVPGLGSDGAQGDGNGDGVQDSLQPSVVSAPLDRNGASGQSFVTLVVDSVNGKPAAGSDARLVEFAPVTTPSDLPSWAQAPVGEIGFTAEVGAAGATRMFSLYVDAALGVNGYWARNGEGTLVNLGEPGLWRPDGRRGRQAETGLPDHRRRRVRLGPRRRHDHRQPRFGRTCIAQPDRLHDRPAGPDHHRQRLGLILELAGPRGPPCASTSHRQRFEGRPMNSIRTRSLASVAATLVLAACGGGGGGGEPQLHSAELQGYWTGDITGTALGTATKARAIVLEDGNAWIFLHDGSQPSEPLLGLATATVSPTRQTFAGTGKRYPASGAAVADIAVSGGEPRRVWP